MSDHQLEQEEFENGHLVIYRRKESNGCYHCRIRFPNHPYIRKSLKTNIREEAIRYGKDFYWDCQTRLKKNIPFDRKKISTLLQLFIDHLSTEKNRGRISEYQFRHKKLMTERYLFRFFDQKELCDLTEDLIRSYKKWREDFWTTGQGRKINQVVYERGGKKISRNIRKKLPSDNTLRIEHSLLNVFLSFLVEEGYLKGVQKPVVKRSFNTKRRRFTFLDSEYETLCQFLSEDIEKSRENKDLCRKRENLREFILLMTHFGTRPSELLNLRWRDITTTIDGEKVVRVTIRVNGKTGIREVVGVQGVHEYLKRLWDRSKMDSEGQKMNPESVYHEKPFRGRDEYIFVNRLGVQIQSFTRGFNNLLERSGLYIDPLSQTPRSLYSLRHFYGTNRLKNGDSIYDISLNMGTSVQMIEKHYSHVLTRDRVEVLSKRYFGMDDENLPKAVSMEDV